jgi:hypothetical protein
LPVDHLRAGTVKARRPRVSAGGAKRSALHGAEHRCSIGVVMAGGVDVQAKGHHVTRRRVHIERSVRPPRCSDNEWPAHHARTGSVNEHYFPDGRDRIFPKI